MVEAYGDRLEVITAEGALDFDLDRLGADMRDACLEIVRHRPKAYDQMTEAEQRDVSNLIQNACNAVLAHAVLQLAAEDRPYIEARLEKFAAKSGKYQATLMAQGSPELAADLARLDGHDVLIISADASAYTRRHPAPIQPDQAPLEFAEDEPEGEPQPPHDPATGELIDGTGDEELDEEVRIDLDSGMRQTIRDGDLHHEEEASEDELEAERQRQALATAE